MIQELTIKKLFNQFDYNIKFNEGGITIITGPNGFGKSTILRIIEALIEKDMLEISKFVFEEIFIRSNTLSLTIQKNESGLCVDGCNLKVYPKRTIDIFNRKHGFSYIERIDNDSYLDFRNDKIYSAEEYRSMIKQYEEDDSRIKDILIAINYEQAESNHGKRSQFRNLYEKLLRFRESVGKIKFIREQRLIRQEIINEEYYGREKKTRTIEVINEIPNKMREEIRKVILNYSEITSQLDSTYPNRLFKTNKKITQEDFLVTFGEIIGKQEKIKQYSLIKDLNIKAPEEFKDEYAKALRIYLEDTKQKLSVFDDLIDKLNIFVETLNAKLNYKKVVISSEYGLQVKKQDDTELSLKSLSSGEQQIITLYFELIFGIKDNIILIIDEPEISLHVAWQRELMSDFNKIISLKENNLNVIIATHSPQVINNYWENIIDLGEQNAE